MSTHHAVEVQKAIAARWREEAGELRDQVGVLLAENEELHRARLEDLDENGRLQNEVDDLRARLRKSQGRTCEVASHLSEASDTILALRAQVVEAKESRDEANRLLDKAVRERDTLRVMADSWRETTGITARLWAVRLAMRYASEAVRRHHGHLTRENKRLNTIAGDLMDIAVQDLDRVQEAAAAADWMVEHADTLDRNWSILHESCMGAIREAIRDAVGVEDTTVPEIVHAIGDLKFKANALADTHDGLMLAREDTHRLREERDDAEHGAHLLMWAVIRAAWDAVRMYEHLGSSFDDCDDEVLDSGEAVPKRQAVVIALVLLCLNEVGYLDGEDLADLIAMENDR